MRKAFIACMLAVLVLLTAADCRGSKPNPRKPQPTHSGCANLPEGCPLQTGRQPAPTATP